MKLSLTLGALALFNALLAVLVPWYIVTQVGVGVQSDSYFASTALPQFVFLFFSATVTNVVVPLFVTLPKPNFQRDAWSLFLLVATLFGSAALVLAITASFWVPLLVPGFSGEAKQLTIALSRIQLLNVLGNALVVVLWSFHYARERFIWAECSPVVANVITLYVLVQTLPRFGIKAAAWAAVLNLALKTALLLPILGRWQWPRWRSTAIIEIYQRARPFVFGQAYAKADPLLDRFLTSMTTTGSLSLLYIAQQIYGSVSIILAKAVSSPSVPRLAMAAGTADWPNFKRTYRLRLWWMAGLTAIGYLALLTVGQSLLHLMIGHGGVTTQNVTRLWWIMVTLVGLLAGNTIGQIAAIAFYAMGDTKTPTIIFIWTFTLYLPLKVLLFLRYGVIGVAIAISAHLILNFVVQIFVLERRISMTQRASASRLVPPKPD